VISARRLFRISTVSDIWDCCSSDMRKNKKKKKEHPSYIYKLSTIQEFVLLMRRMLITRMLEEN